MATVGQACCEGADAPLSSSRGASHALHMSPRPKAPHVAHPTWAMLRAPHVAHPTWAMLTHLPMTSPTTPLPTCQRLAARLQQNSQPLPNRARNYPPASLLPPACSRMAMYMPSLRPPTTSPPTCQRLATSLQQDVHYSLQAVVVVGLAPQPAGKQKTGAQVSPWTPVACHSRVRFEAFSKSVF